MEPPSKPIVSTRTDDPAYGERIDAFVARLGERVDAFQDAALAEDGVTLRRLAESFAGEAHDVGFPPLAAAARRIHAACQDEAPDALRKAVAELTDVSQLVRRGHRSSA